MQCAVHGTDGSAQSFGDVTQSCGRSAHISWPTFLAHVLDGEYPPELQESYAFRQQRKR